MSISLRPYAMDCQAPPPCPWGFPDKGMGCRSLFQGIFQSRDRIRVFCIARRLFTLWARKSIIKLLPNSAKKQVQGCEEIGTLLHLLWEYKMTWPVQKTGWWLLKKLKTELPNNPAIPFVGIYTEKAMAPHSSTLAWKIPWTEEPGGLQSMGLLRVGHDWATSLSLFTFMHWRRKWQPTPVFLPGESQGWGTLVGCRLWGRRESDTTEVT